MPRPTDIDDGGNGDHHDEWARRHLLSLIVEILRAVARGDDRQYRVEEQLMRFLERVTQMSAPLHDIIQKTVEAAHDRSVAVRYNRVCDTENSIRSIVRAALRLAAETCAMITPLRRVRHATGSGLSARSRRSHALADLTQRILRTPGTTSESDGLGGV